VELRAYGTIIMRRLWIIAPIVLIVALYVAYQTYILYRTPGALRAFQSATTLRIGLQATPQSTDQNYSNYLTISETLADEIITAPVLNSQEFAVEVSHQIQRDMPILTQRFGPNPDLGTWQDPRAIASAISTSRIHNLVTVTVTWSTPAGAWAVANAVGEVSEAHISRYLDYVIRTTPTPPARENTAHPLVAAKIISSASEAAPVSGSASNRPLLLLALLLVACVASIALAFLVEYLDDRIRSGEDVEDLLSLPIIGEIPQAPRKQSAQRPPAA
jgi:capsular polysaccharide biosynthesis protein